MVANKNPEMKPLIERVHNSMYSMWKSGWKPHKDSKNFLEWRYRRFNKQADHIANMTMLNRKSFSYRDTRLIEAIKPGNANILIFSDGGFWEHDGIGSAAWLAYVLGGRWGDQDTDVHLIASEGIFLESNVTSFKAEMIAAESAVIFLNSLSLGLVHLVPFTLPGQPCRDTVEAQSWCGNCLCLMFSP